MQRMTMPNFCINFLNKAAKLLSISYDFAVASSSDAWIKTIFLVFVLILLVSHPPRMRGLKHPTLWTGIMKSMSHPPRMRGLKHYKNDFITSTTCRTLLGCVD